MRVASTAVAVVVLVLILGGCGDSSEQKAQNTVCDARDDIEKQVNDLASLTPATITTDAVKQDLDAIKSDVSDMADAQSGVRTGQLRLRMAERNAAKKGTQQPAKRTTGKASKGFTDEERAAMKERAREQKAAARRGPRGARRTGNATCSRRSPRCRNRIASWPNGSMR